MDELDDVELADADVDAALPLVFSDKGFPKGWLGLKVASAGTLSELH